METATEKLANGNEITYQITPEGTAYHAETPAQLVKLLEDARQIGTRLRFYYGDPVTGRLWGDVETGRIGRSTGRIKIPLVIKTRRSTGGGALLDNCIVKLETASGRLPVYYVANCGR